MAHFSPPEDLEDHLLEEDYYAFLNLDKNASQEDIVNAYRRFSRLYHPDKHTDPTKKKNAEIIFNKIKKAHEVLHDSHKRAIYDTLGTKGLEMDGWQIIERTKTAQEIREEYEELERKREERILNQRTNPKGTINMVINATDLFETYDFEGLPVFEISSMSISQSVEAPLRMNEYIVLNGGLSTQNGNGSGNINCSYKHVLSDKSYLEAGVGAGDGFVFNCKGFRTIRKHICGTLQTSFHFTDSGLSPGVELMLARQFDKETVGYLTWKAGSHSSLNTMIIRETEKGRFVASFNISPRSDFISLSYAYKLEDGGKLKGNLRLGAFGAIVEYGCDKKISQHNTLGASMVIGVPVGVSLKIRVNRASQNFVFGIHLSEEILPSAIFYGTASAICGYYLMKIFIIDPYHKKEKQRKTEKEKEANAQRIAERRKESAIAVSLMQETYKRIKDVEETKNGLIILKAVYGSVENISNLNTDEIESNLDVLDATVQIQCLVKDSRLILTDRPKSNLPGLYDPCLGEDKQLRVDYTYRNINHSTTIKDNEMLRIP